MLDYFSKPKLVTMWVCPPHWARGSLGYSLGFRGSAIFLYPLTTHPAPSAALDGLFLATREFLCFRMVDPGAEGAHGGLNIPWTSPDGSPRPSFSVHSQNKPLKCIPENWSEFANICNYIELSFASPPPPHHNLTFPPSHHPLLYTPRVFYICSNPLT